MNAVYLLARWVLDGLASETLPSERQAVGRLRLGMAARLPPAERDELLRLLDGDDPTTPDSADRWPAGKESPPWHD